MEFDMGTSCTLALPGGTKLVMTTSNGAHFSAELFALALGVPATDRAALESTVFGCNLVVAKSPGGFRATYGRYAERMISSEAPGCAPPRFWLPLYDAMYAHVEQDLFPWVADVPGWAPEGVTHASQRALAPAASDARL